MGNKKYEVEKGFDDVNRNFLDEESKEFLDNYEDELEVQRERIAEEKEIEAEEKLDELLSKLSYLKNEYIVEGAQLACSRCTKEPRTLRYKGETINCNYDNKNSRDRIYIFEERAEEINGLVPVNVEDCKGGLRDDREKDECVNIVSMGNCTFFSDGKNIEEIIGEGKCINNPEDIIEAINKGLGSCYCFMNLNEKWENMPLGMANGLAELPSAGIESVFNTPSYMKFNGKEGINMMSMLFCNLGGGCITALESGQNRGQFKDLSDDEILFVTTIFGEAGYCSEVAWQAVANVIMNRVGKYDWKKYTTPVEVIKYSGFTAYNSPNEPFREAKSYFEERDYSNEQIEKMIEIVIPIFRGKGEDITNNAIAYYSPNAQKALHEKYPEKYPEIPNWTLSQTVEKVEIDGLKNDDFQFYKYKQE